MLSSIVWIVPLIFLSRAFQKLGFAFEILKTPSSRRSYDAALRPASTSQRHGDAPAFLGGDYTFRTAVDALISDFVTGDFVLVRKALSALHKQYPNLVSLATVSHVEHAFVRIRELALAARTHALLIYIELRRIRRVQLRLSALGYLDVLGRARLTIELVRVTLAVPVRVDRALKTRAQKEWKSRTAGLSAAGLPLPEVEGRAGILNENVCKVLEFIVGEASCDKEADEADEAWDTSATAPPRAA